MIPFLLIGAIALYLFRHSNNAQTPSFNSVQPSVITYKPLIQDLIKNHGMSRYKWNDNMKINKTLDGFGIGSSDAFVLIADNKPISLYINKEKIDLGTFDTNQAVEKLIEITNSNVYPESIVSKIKIILNILIKAKTYYYFNKYIKKNCVQMP